MKKIISALIFIIITIATIWTGNPMVKNDNIINITIGLTGIYIIISKIIKKEKIINNKEILLMFILVLSSILPLIFNTYISLSGTVYYILRYISVFIMYVIVTNEIEKNGNKGIELIKNIIIISGIILVILGIDLLTSNITYDFIVKIIGKATDQEILTRMYSVFLYSNTFAICVIASYLLGIERAINGKKAIYSGISTLLLCGIILSQSRASLLVLAVVLIMYLLILKKEDRYKLVKIVGTTLIFSIIYVTTFMYMKRAGNFIITWGAIFLIIIVSSYVYKKIKNYEKIEKFISIKYIAIGIIIIIGAIMILSIFKSNLVLFNNEKAQTKITKNIYDLKENTEYEIELEMEAKSNTSTDNYLIELIQRNAYSDNIAEEKININNYDGLYKVNIKTEEGIKWLEFSVSAHSTSEENKLVIKELKINGKKIVLNYKYLPTDLINQLKYVNLSQRSVQERKVFIIDGFKIIKKYGLWGIGGDGYKYVVKEVQSYFYGVAQMHSYIMQVIIELGLIGTVAFVVLTIITIKKSINIIKNGEAEKYGIILAFVALLLHSMVDFDMSFLYTMIIFYTLVAIINFKTESDFEKKGYLLSNIIIIFMVCTSTILNATDLYAQLTYDKKMYESKTYEEKINTQKFYMRLVPYSNKYRTNCADYIRNYITSKNGNFTEEDELNSKMVNLLQSSIKYEKRDINNMSKCLKMIRYGDENQEADAYKKINEILSCQGYNSGQILTQYQELSSQNNKKIQDIIGKNIDKSIDNIRKYEQCRITKQESEEIIKELEEIKKGE